MGDDRHLCVITIEARELVHPFSPLGEEGPLLYRPLEDEVIEVKQGKLRVGEYH